MVLSTHLLLLTPERSNMAALPVPIPIRFSGSSKVMLNMSVPKQLWDPKLTPEGLKGHDEGFYNAVVNGLEWTVLSASLINKWPCLLQMFSESSNTGGQLQRRESECQMGLRILNLVKGGMKEYKHLKDRLLRSKPTCFASVPFIYSFLLKFGGGPESPLFLETCHLF